MVFYFIIITDLFLCNLLKVKNPGVPFFQIAFFEPVKLLSDRIVLRFILFKQK